MVKQIQRSMGQVHQVQATWRCYDSYTSCPTETCSESSASCCCNGDMIIPIHHMFWPWHIISYNRRKSSNFWQYGQMEKERWEESEKRREEKKREDQRRERVRRKKMQVREKVERSRNTVFFQWFVAPEGRKVGSLKRRVRRHLVRWEMKNCTPFWREPHLEVKMYKAPHVRTCSDDFWKLRCRNRSL